MKDLYWYLSIHFEKTVLTRERGTDMKYKLVKLEIKGDVALLTLDDPDVLNAMGIEMLEETKKAVAEASGPDSGVRCLVITGAGRGFCAGANLSRPAEAADSESPPPPPGRGLDETYNPFLLTLKNLNMPIITAVNGPAAGVGMSVALMGDMVLASKSAFFLQAFRRIGLIPDGGSTYTLPRMIGMARAMELSLLGERLSAEKALEWGLINRVYEDNELMDEAMKLARELASGPTVALRLIRKAYWESPDNNFKEQLHLEAILQAEAQLSEDALEGADAFREKRDPDFKGK